MILKLAFRNLRGAGLRTWINVFILSLVYVTIVWFQAMYAGWMLQAERDTIQWEVGGGEASLASYDRYDPFSWDDAHAPLPQSLRQLQEKGNAAPVLISSGVVYPHQRRHSVLLKGIDQRQTVLHIPTDSMRVDDGTVPVLIGFRLARMLDVKQGDSFVLKWRSGSGTFDAADVTVACIMDAPLASIDAGQMWLPLHELQRMKQLPGQATYVVAAQGMPVPQLPEGWRWQSTQDLLSDLRAIMKTESVGEYIIFALLTFMAMIAIFDTQVLALFRRRKEMGTLLALGLTRRQLIGLFTLEGVLHAALGVLLAAVWGTPLLVYFGVAGWKMPDTMDQYGMAGMHDAVIFHYTPWLVLRAVLVVLCITTLVSWWPTRRIARLKPTDALRGKFS